MCVHWGKNITVKNLGSEYFFLLTVYCIVHLCVYKQTHTVRQCFQAYFQAYLIHSVLNSRFQVWKIQSHYCANNGGNHERNSSTTYCHLSRHTHKFDATPIEYQSSLCFLRAKPSQMTKLHHRDLKKPVVKSAHLF